MRRIDIIGTQAISPRDLLEYWSSNAGNQVAPVAMHRLGDEDFNASLETRSLRNVSLLSLRATPCCINTRPDDHQTGMALIAKSKAFSEDKLMIQAQQLIIDRDPSQQEVPIAADKRLVLFQRKMKQPISLEQSGEVN